MFHATELFGHDATLFLTEPHRSPAAAGLPAPGGRLGGTRGLELSPWSVFLHECCRYPLLNDLHAKLFVADERCLVGSANLTGSALGWSEFSNVELLVSVPAENGDVAVLLQHLEAAEPATFAKRSEVEREAATLEVGNWIDGSPVTGDNRSRAWLPRCAAPDRLFDIYQNPDTVRVAEETRQDGLADLADLRIAPGLSPERFVAAVSGALRRIPSITRILEAVPGIVRDSRGVELVTSADPGVSRDDAALHWRIVRDWIRVFFADEFEVAPESFVTRLRPR